MYAWLIAKHVKVQDLAYPKIPLKFVRKTI